MKELREYLKGTRHKTFARQLGISQPYLSQILTAKRRPGYDLMCRIERVTDGKIPLSAWRDKKVFRCGLANSRATGAGPRNMTLPARNAPNATATGAFMGESDEGGQ